MLTDAQWGKDLEWLRFLVDFDDDSIEVSYTRRWRPYSYLDEISPARKCKLYRQARRRLLRATEQE